MPGGYVGGRPKDESKLSTKPAQVRRRLRRAWNSKDKQHNRDGRIARDIEMLYGRPVSQWDLEELAHGRPRNRNGEFSGVMPVWVTPTVQLEAKRRLVNTTLGKLTANVELAIRTVVNLMNSDEVDDKGKPIVDARTKLAAATFIIESIIGKPKATLDLGEIQDGIRTALLPAMILEDGKPQGHLTKVIEGETTSNDEASEEDDDDE